MSLDLLLLLLDRIGVFVFAVSGGVLAVRLRMDVLGVLVLAFLPALGGGTLRDLVLDAPVFWLGDGWSLAMVALGAAAAFFFTPFLEGFKPIRWADAVGMALFAVTGAAKAMELGFGLPIIVIMGGLTASAGGLLRDVVANREPLLLKEDIYATAALLGALGFALCVRAGLPPRLATGAGFALAFGLRACAIRYGWSLPSRALDDA